MELRGPFSPGQADPRGTPRRGLEAPEGRLRQLDPGRRGWRERRAPGGVGAPKGRLLELAEGLLASHWLGGKFKFKFMKYQ